MLRDNKITIALRGYAVGRAKARGTGHGRQQRPELPPSEWSLTWDTETFTDHAQQVRIVPYQVRRGESLHEGGLAYDPLSLSDDERSLLHAYCAKHGLMARTLEEFTDEVFFEITFWRRGACVGFNLPFDIARIAIAHDSARGEDMRGGFTLKLGADDRLPRVRVRHLNSRESLIQFTSPQRQRAGRGMRNRKIDVPIRRGAFVDARMLAAALTSRSFTLKDLADFLQTEHRKLTADEHGGPLTDEYLDYAMRDVQVTWECFEQLRAQYVSYGLTKTLVHQIYSEASIGKACLREMGIRTWRELQPEFPPELIGIIMSTYFGGRSEVNIRREIRRVLYQDFKSMYPTVCTLMGLWQFVIANSTERHDATNDVVDFLRTVQPEDLQDPATWTNLAVLVQVVPDGDWLPVRADYDAIDHPSESGAETIGLNYLTSNRPLWFTLADCIASKFKTGKAPRVLHAIRFVAGQKQSGLRPLAVAGNPAFVVNPAVDDFYRRLIDLRSQVKGEMKQARDRRDEEPARRLDAQQTALKIMASATSYGIFIELNVIQPRKPVPGAVYGPFGEGTARDLPTFERPGRYFHPLLATLITGAARLMLALAEGAAEREGLTWVFCDTDSMALSPPEGMSDEDFIDRGERVRAWFTPLNPYADPAPLFELEDANFGLMYGVPSKKLEPLFCFAISPKRYVLFNLDRRGRPIIRKASAHGLGHRVAPYDTDHAPRSIPKPAMDLADIGVRRWEYDYWYRIAQAALAGHPDQVNLSGLPGFDQPDRTEWAATSPTVLRWFNKFNADRPYRERVRPFGFMNAFHPKVLAVLAEEARTAPFTRRGRHAADSPHPVSPFHRDLDVALKQCFDRETGNGVDREQLKTLAESLATYHLHPETKFNRADYMSALS